MSQDLIIPYLPKPQETRLDAKKRTVDRVVERPVIPADEQQAQQAEQERLIHLQQQLGQQQQHQQNQSQNKQTKPQPEVETDPDTNEDQDDGEHINLYI